MAFTVTLCDETTRGDRRPAGTLELPAPTLTARELIRTRVFTEVRAHGEGRAEPFRGLVEPAPQERLLQPDRSARPAARRPIDWHEQVRIALEAFERNGFLLLVDGRQVEALDEELRLRHDSEVVFLKLLPLVGG
jgi:hypothetical protein